jgi:hypothetical protein
VGNRGFAGHCVLWLPELQRLVDPTIQQFPELSSEDGPFIGRVGAANQALPGELPVGSDIPIPRNGAVISASTGALRLRTLPPPGGLLPAFRTSRAAAAAAFRLLARKHQCGSTVAEIDTPCGPRTCFEATTERAVRCPCGSDRRPLEKDHRAAPWSPATGSVSSCRRPSDGGTTEGHIPQKVTPAGKTNSDLSERDPG